MPLFFAMYFEAADKLNPALINSSSSFFKSDLLILKSLSFLTPFITIVIKGVNKESNSVINKSDLKKELNELIKAGLSLSAASKYLAKKNEIKKSEIYNLN